MSSLPASLKRIGSTATEKKWWSRFFRCSRAANSIVSGGIWPKFKLIQAFMHVLIICKYEKDPIKKQPRKRDDVVFPIISLQEFFPTLKGSQLRCPWSDPAKFRTHASTYVCHSYLQVSKGSDQKQPRKCDDALFPIITLRELAVAIETRVLIWSAPKPSAAFPPSQWCFI